MEIKPGIGIVLIILVLLSSILLSLILATRNIPHHLIMPKAETTMEIENDNLIFTITSLNLEVPMHEVSLNTYDHVEGNITSNYIHEIGIANKYEIYQNYSFFDKDRDKKLSIGDLFIFRTDWDGPKSDGNQDGNFINDGPVQRGDRFVLEDIHGFCICNYELIF